MDYASIVMIIGVALLKLFVGLVLTLVSICYGVKFFDSLTRNIDEWKEMKKGNAAVGLMLGAVVLSIAILTSPGIFVLSSAIDLTTFSWITLGMGVIVYIVTFLISLFSVYVSIRLLDVIDTQDINKIDAIKKGNVAMGVFVASVIVATSAVVLLLEINAIFGIFPIFIG